MDRVGKILDEISRMPELASLDRRASSFFNDTAEIYEKHGPGTTKVYLLNQRMRRRFEVPLLLKVLEKFEASPEIRSNRAIGRQIIKCLTDLKGGAPR